jgi:3-deoxy-D-manno-octulosonic-acid transferase
MALSLGRTLYNLKGRGLQLGESSRPPRPSGPLVWLHAPDPDYATGTAQLALRLITEGVASVLLTCPEPLNIAHPRLVQHTPPPDTASDARAFLGHWSPDLAILSDGELRPALLFEAETRRLPLLMVEARSPYLPKGRAGWYPGLIRSSLNSFHEIMALDEASARAFRKAGAAKVTLSGRMEEPSAALHYQEPERASLAQQMATRPVWLAAAVPAAEEAAVIAAHRTALRLAHRLLLILVPQDPGRAAELAAGMEAAEGWSVALRSLEQEPDTEVSVYIPDSAAEFGLWYRLAPVTYLGGSLLGDGCARNPMEAAALGSAIIHGPKPGVYGPLFNRFGAERAARSITSAADLGEALSDLLAPDRTARLAQAAWSLASDGVEVTEQIISLTRRLLQGAA